MGTRVCLVRMLYDDRAGQGNERVLHYNGTSLIVFIRVGGFGYSSVCILLFQGNLRTLMSTAGYCSWICI